LRLPITNQKIVATGEPKRGDVVVFRPPQHPDEDWIKRVIGLPGDTVAYRNDTVYINGEPLHYVSQGRFVGTGRDAEATGAKLLLEQLPGRPHPVLERDDRPYFIQGEGQWTVPAGSYFVMGDNRDNSEDSRFWGFLPESDLRGKAFLVWMSWDGDAGGVNFRRIGSRIP
jgi:signal peptidase I